MTIYTATSQAQADKMIASLVAGDTLKLIGNFGPWRPGGRKFTAPVTIDCTGATLTDIYTGGWGNVVWLGGQWKIGKTYNTALRDESSTGCRYKDMAIDGAGGPLSGYDTAIWLRGGSNASIENPTITSAQNGIWAMDIDGLKILGGSITDTGSDAIQIADCNALVDGTTILRLNPSPGDHPDMIQVRSGVGKPRCDVTIQNVKGEGNGQCIFITPDDGGAGFGTVTVEGCNLKGGYVRALTVDGALKSIVAANDVSTLPGSTYQASIQVPASDGNNVRSGNIVRSATLADGSVARAIIDADYVAPAPAPAPTPAPSPAPSPTPAPKPSPTPTPAAKPPADVKVTLKPKQRLIVTGAANVVITGAA